MPDRPARVDSLVTLPSLFLSSFLAATLLPGGSEVVLYALLAREPALLWPALGVATLGNTLGALSTFLLGWLVPRRPPPDRAMGWMRRFGAPALLLSWLPLIGDALCLAAGWLRVAPAAAALFIALGKGVRYWVVAQAALA
jgi:membrane protein YqaA with SNARE-associated domain